VTVIDWVLKSTWRDVTAPAAAAAAAAPRQRLEGGAQSSRRSWRSSMMGGTYAVAEFWLVTLATLSSALLFVYAMIFMQSKLFLTCENNGAHGLDNL